MINPKIFKDYDIRAEIGSELDEDGVRRIARAFAALLTPQTVAIGHDMRITADMVTTAWQEELTSMGVNVIDLGLITTDASYFAAGTLDADYVIMVTASHNPARYNGFKFTKKGGIALDGESTIYPLRDKALADETWENAKQPGKLTKEPKFLEQFVKHTLQFVDVDNIKPLKVLVDAGNGMAGAFMPIVEKYLPIKVEPLYFELDGNFPNHPSYPLIEAGQKDAREALKKGNYDLGVLFDGDGDRMFLMDEHGEFVSGTITTAMVAKLILDKNPGETLLYNAICGRVVPEIIEKNGGKSERTRVGHSLIKKKMRQLNAIFAGEHSGHYFFRDFFYADSGLITMLMALEYISQQGKPASETFAQFDKYPSSGEINFEVEDKQAVIAALEEAYQDQANSIDHLDGITIWFDTWWANIRPSNTQPLLRLNVEADNNKILEDKTTEFIEFIEKQGGQRSFE